MRNLNLKILTALISLTWAGSGVSQGQGSMDIKEFVRQFYIHGVPYAEASKYDASVVPTLLKMLQEPKEQDHWSNIVVTLGMIGDESAVEPMIAFVERLKEKGTPNRSQRRAKTAAVMSLGYLINKSGSQRALDYLTTTLKPQAWTDSLPAAAGPFAATTAEQDEDLGKYAAMGLALSGSRKAAEALKATQESLESSDHPMALPMATVSAPRSGFDVSEMVEEALRANQEIADKGLAEYYR
ncbi:HEAT repeat domain-containing protein [Candidatus Thiosymbion oneisti]|uniref:HEAT repeat domain-containing protein n=1 Tax=Candidatus Thiosymbion oneisti TaxID=589554 RepID=UPI00105EFDC6|nr:hypothetical protein [Candidatus Thiosymbion oneisti]